MSESEKPRPAPPVDASPRDDVHVAASPVRCPFCHEHVAVDALAWVACAGCLARHHGACWHEGARCAACGQRDPLVGRRRLPRVAIVLVTLIMVAVVAAAASAIVGARERAEHAEALLAAQAARERETELRARRQAAVVAYAIGQNQMARAMAATGAIAGEQLIDLATQAPRLRTSVRFTVLEDGHGHWVGVASDVPHGPATSIVFGLGSWVLDLDDRSGLRVRPIDKHIQAKVSVPKGARGVIIHDARGVPTTTHRVESSALDPAELWQLLRQTRDIDVLDLLRRVEAAD